MKHIQAIGFAIVVGAGLTFGQAAKAMDDPWGLSSYIWVVSWAPGSSTWCFNQYEDGTYYGMEIGMGRAAANSVTYDMAMHVLTMNATSRDNTHTAQYTWTMSVDENNLPTASAMPGSIVFSRWIDPDTHQARTDPLTEEISIVRGDPRPAYPCDGYKP